MKILSIDTASNLCTVAVLENQKCIKEIIVNDARNHSEKIMPVIEQALQETALTLKNIDLIVCDKGPGSFTGIRIGVGTVIAFQDCLAIPCVGISSLETLAYNVNTDGIICSLIDAKNDNVYAALFAYKDRPYMLGNYISDSVNSLINVLKTKDCNILFVGDGAIAYKELFKKEFDEKAFFMPYHLNFQTAVSIAKAAVDKAKLGEFDDYNTITPLYLKKSQAERMLDLNAKDTDN